MSTVYLNGKFMPIDAACVSVMDRGFLFGDGVYEVIPVYGGRLFRLDQHLQRLASSLDAIRALPVAFSNGMTVPLGSVAWVEEGLGVGRLGSDDEALHRVARAGEIAFPVSEAGDDFAQTEAIELDPLDSMISDTTRTVYL